MNRGLASGLAPTFWIVTMAAVTWLGDGDPEAQAITQYGHAFVKGEPTDVPDNDPSMAKFKAMHVFSVGKAADIVDSDGDANKERGAVKAELDKAGIKYDGRASLAKLRELLAA